MRQKIELERLYQRALRLIVDSVIDGAPPQRLPVTCPFTLDQLLAERRTALEDVLREAVSRSQG
jgi:hypothetical protein